jgi:serine protease AprX
LPHAEVLPLNDELTTILPTPDRLRADPRFTGKGITLALVDSGFYPIADLTRPTNRIRAWVDANDKPVRVVPFSRTETPTWAGYNDGAARHWHGLMTSTVAAGNGFQSQGIYRGLASDADVVLVRVTGDSGGIPNRNIVAALEWLEDSIQDYNIRVVSLSVAGDPVKPLLGNPIDEAIKALVARGVVVVAAAGNDGVRRLTPPATAPDSLTIGGLDDHNSFDPEDVELWHSNYGESNRKLPKPELVAPSIWVAAPILPGSQLEAQARAWFEQADRENIAAQKLITPHYQHVEGTSFAAPMVAGTIACMLEANPALTPFDVRRILLETAQPVPNASEARQGAGALNAAGAVTAALALKDRTGGLAFKSPHVEGDRVTFVYRDPRCRQVRVRGEWDGWSEPGLVARRVEEGVWTAEMPKPAPGFYAYRFLIDDKTWIDDPENPQRRTNLYGEFDSVLVVS